MQKALCAFGALIAVLAPPPALAADSRAAGTAKDLAEIRDEIKQLKDSYESRIQALEARLKEAESKARAAEIKAATAVAAQSAQTASAAPASPAPVLPAPTSGRGGGIAAFNPAVSLVLQGRYTNLSQDPNRFAISGFIPGGDVGPGKRGFSLDESELNLDANVDQHFFGHATLAFLPDSRISAEEVYFLTTSLPTGLTLKAGRFFSGIGYQNDQHQHVWDFIDAPLAYQAFLGGQFGNDGAQLKWLAPTDIFLELGVEAGNGENFPGSARNRNGVNASALALRVGDDIGVSHSWLVGLSALRTHAENRNFTQTDSFGNDAASSFTGRSNVAIADFVYKYAPNGNPIYTNFKLQGEYFHRRETGDLTFDANGALGLTNGDAYRSTQSGWYMQGVYQFAPYWRVGLRYDRLDAGTLDLASNAANLGGTGFNPDKTSVMVDWSPSEFSRFRLQAAREHRGPGVTDNQLFLQYILTIGAHGAHKF